MVAMVALAYRTPLLEHQRPRAVEVAEEAVETKEVLAALVVLVVEEAALIHLVQRVEVALLILAVAVALMDITLE